MFQRDYVLRMIEMMGDLMRRLKELLDQHAQMRLLDEACRRHCGIPLETLQRLSAESLMELLAPMPRFFASELLRVEALAVCLPEEEEEAQRLMSARLLASLWEEGQVCELRALQLKQMKAQLLPKLTAKDLMNCAEFFFQGGLYDEMEDAVFQAFDISNSAERKCYGERGNSLLLFAAQAQAMEARPIQPSSQELRDAAQELAQKIDVADKEVHP
ncbi:MAG: DUF6483 family protein [Clostridia bacterium]